MSATPLTDANTFASPYIAVGGEAMSYEMVDANFCRELERQLTAIAETLNLSHAPVISDGEPYGHPLTLPERIAWLHTEKGLADARLKAIQKVWQEKFDAADKMRGEALLALGVMQNERDAYAAHVTKESRISDSEMMALLRRRAALVDEIEKELSAAIRERDEARARTKELEAVEAAMHDKAKLCDRMIEEVKQHSTDTENQIREERDKLKAEVDRIIQHVGAPTLTEAFNVLGRTKEQDEDKIQQQFDKIKEQARELIALRQELERRKWVSPIARMPTSEDGDKRGDILFMDPHGACGFCHWSRMFTVGFWMRIPPLPAKQEPDEDREEFVPLGPEDVTQGSVLTNSGLNDGEWFLILRMFTSGVAVESRASIIPWDELARGWKIKRPGEDWMPCHKAERKATP